MSEQSTPDPTPDPPVIEPTSEPEPVFDDPGGWASKRGAQPDPKTEHR